MVVGIRNHVARGFSRSGQTVIPGRGRRIRHHDSHSRLVSHANRTPAESDGPPELDAIIVPASRSAHNLDHAITLARAVGCHLVILCSRDAQPVEVFDLLTARSFFEATVVEIPANYEHKIFQFETTDWVKRQFPARKSDLSIKRNVGLAMARMLAWQRIFFLDDDIRDLDANALRATASLLGTGSAEQSCYSAGMSSIDYPDNSVICHARRAIGKSQDVFVSGSALAVDCTASFSFFPDVYNEDWLFFYRDAAEGRLGTSGHTATQLRYDPFASPQRAADQEFGDVIAEGLYALLEEKLSAEYASVERWEQFIADRRQMIEEIIDLSAEASDNIREKMLYAAEIARKTLEQIRPQMCVDYIARWRRDLVLWEETLKHLPRMASIRDALKWLEL
ncbi:MAG TPA: hypothetical protein VIZ43_28065 [Trebonia sp.]